MSNLAESFLKACAFNEVKAFELYDKAYPHHQNDFHGMCRRRDWVDARQFENDRLAPLLAAVSEVVKACEAAKQSADWYANTFAGWEDRQHEFEHWWRVEMPHLLDEALTRLREVLK